MMENDTENSKDNHRTEPQARKCDVCRFLLAEEMSEGQILFFLPSIYFFLGQGNPWNLHLSRFYCPK